MNGHNKRAIKKTNQIKKSALELFNKYGANKVTIDEIANYANVSKVTIYKYFGSKNDLYKEIIKMIYKENIERIENIIYGPSTFVEKLKFLITTKSNALQFLKGDFIKECIRNDYEIKEYIEINYGNKIKKLMFAFLDQGKKEGYIDNNISNDVIYIYIEIFTAGLEKKSSELESIIANNHTFEKLINLYFYGLIKS